MAKNTLMFVAILMLLQFATRTSAVSIRLATVNPTGCTGTPINNRFGQSFQFHTSTTYTFGQVEVYIQPNPTSLTSYQVRLHSGTGCGGTVLGTSLTTNVPQGNLGGMTGWYPFSFPNEIVLYPNTVYTLEFLQTTSTSGSYFLCGNMYNDGSNFDGNCNQGSGDIAFRLNVTGYPRIQPGTTVSLRSRLNNQYVSGNNFNVRQNQLIANRNAVGQYESFLVESVRSGVIALKCVQNNRYVRVDSSTGQNNILLCDQVSRGTSGEFREVNAGNGASALMAFNNLYVGAQSDGSLRADQTNIGPGPEEAFSVAVVP